jgi:hypothetical protein
VAACAALAVLGVFAWKIWNNDLKFTTAKMKARDIAKACERYFIDQGHYPAELDDLLAQDDGKMPYLTKDTLTDPWGNAFKYETSDGSGQGTAEPTTTPRIYCISPDGRSVGNVR